MPPRIGEHAIAERRFTSLSFPAQTDPDRIKGKAKLFVDYEDKMTLFDAFILCRVYRDLITWKDLQVIIKSACNLSLKKKDLKTMASGIINLARDFNRQEGVDEERGQTASPFLSRDSQRIRINDSIHRFEDHVERVSPIEKGRSQKIKHKLVKIKYLFTSFHYLNPEYIKYSYKMKKVVVHACVTSSF